jgi:peptidoglycan/xylan/chitin deacetylase (PgdA/CDA1 family)
MFRSLIKTAAAHAISWTGLDTAARFRLYRGVPFVLAYHRVVERLDADGFALPAMEISVAMLEQHLDWLGRHFRIVSVDDLGTEVEQSRQSLPPAVVTFDDGYRDVFDYAFPLLKRKGIPAAIFVVTDLVDSAELPVHERLHALLVRAWPALTSRNELAPLDRLPKRMRDPFSATRYLLARLSHEKVVRIIDMLGADYEIDADVRERLQPLSWEMLATMSDSGMTIGSHSKTHAVLTNETEQRVHDEADDSRRQLEHTLGIAVRSFAYPGGSFTPSVVEAVAAAGYRYAFTTCGHRDARFPMLTIPRTGLWQQSCRDALGGFSPAIMSCQATGAFRYVSRCTQSHRETPASRNTGAVFTTADLY